MTHFRDIGLSSTSGNISIGNFIIVNIGYNIFPIPSIIPELLNAPIARNNPNSRHSWNDYGSDSLSNDVDEKLLTDYVKNGIINTERKIFILYIFLSNKDLQEFKCLL